MLHGSGQHVRDRLDAAVRMPMKPGEIILRHVVTEIIEQEERIVVRRLTEPEGAAQSPDDSGMR